MFLHSSLSPFLSLMAKPVDLFLKLSDAVAAAPTIGLKLCFTGSASANAAGETRERRILSNNQAGQQVFELRKFHLQLGLATLRALRKDIQDLLGSVDDLEICRFRQR